MDLRASDWLLLAVLALVLPAYSYLSARRLAAQPELASRYPVYLRTIAGLWLLALAMLYIWGFVLERPFAELGLQIVPGATTNMSAAVCVLLAFAVFAALNMTLRASPEKRARMAARLGGTAVILARTKGELGLFYAVALSAGICEELLYRSYFMRVTAPYVTVYGAIAISALAFGLCHLYQGTRGVVRTVAVGLLLGGFYVASGSIVWPMIVHALIDVNGGTVGYLLLRGSRAPSGRAAAP